MKKVLSALTFMLSLGTVSQAWGAHFADPTWNGYALDWCKNFEAGCGQPAADLYCQKRGYSQSAGFQILPTVKVETMTIGQNAICNPNDHRCDSFAYIDCKETTQVFTNPVYNGYRLDWCANFAADCGQPAAQAFCQKAGFLEVVAFNKQGQLNAQTMTIDSNAVCNPQFHLCDGFSSIECKK